MKKMKQSSLDGTQYSRVIETAKEAGCSFVRASQCPNGIPSDGWYVGEWPDDFPISWSEVGDKTYLDECVYLIPVGGPYYRAYGFDSPDMHYSLYLKKEN